MTTTENATPTDRELDMEFAYTSWHQSCHNLLDMVMGCRRPKGHDGQHAAGWGLGRRRWE